MATKKKAGYATVKLKPVTEKTVRRSAKAEKSHLATETLRAAVRAKDASKFGHAAAAEDFNQKRREMHRGRGRPRMVGQIHAAKSEFHHAMAEQAHKDKDYPGAQRHLTKSLEHHVAAKKAASHSLQRGKKGGTFYLSEGKRVYVKKQ